MFHEGIEFLNVTELERVDGLPGLRLRRLPSTVRNALGASAQETGRIMSQTSTGCEIRFVTSATTVRLYLSALDADGEVTVYRGSFFHMTRTLEQGRITMLELKVPEKFGEVESRMLEVGPYAPQVWRVVMNRGFNAVFHHLDPVGHPVRPPDRGEVPGLKWLAYGSSITHGAGATTFAQSYIAQAARRLGVDVLCNGLSGSCQSEPVMADYIATRNDWDFATLELGVNMRMRFTNEQFEQNVRYLIRKVALHHPSKPIVLLTIYPNNSDYARNAQSSSAIHNREYKETLRRIHAEMNHPHLHLVEGADVLTDVSGLTTDLLHPSDYGHMVMGEQLARLLKPFIASLQ